MRRSIKMTTKRYFNFIKKLSILIGVLLIGTLSLFYLYSSFDKPKGKINTNRPVWHIYPQDIAEDSLPAPKVTVAATEQEIKTQVETKEKKSTQVKKLYSENDIITLCKLVYGEGRGLNKTEMSAIAWCVLNRVDSKTFPNTIYEVCTQKSQFSGYKSHHPVWDNIRELVEDVLKRWEREKIGEKNVGRTLPKTYLYFYGDGRHNHYMEKWKSKEYYQWTLKSPYK